MELTIKNTPKLDISTIDNDKLYIYAKENLKINLTDANGNVIFVFEKLYDNNVHLEFENEVYDGPLDLLLK